MKRGFEEFDEMERRMAESEAYQSGDPSALMAGYGHRNLANMHMQAATRTSATLPRSGVTEERAARRVRFAEQYGGEASDKKKEDGDDDTQRSVSLWVDEAEMAEVRFDESALITYVLWFLSWHNRPKPQFPAAVEHLEFMRVLDGFFKSWGPPMNLSTVERYGDGSESSPFGVRATPEYEARQAMVKETLLNMARRGILRIRVRKVEMDGGFFSMLTNPNKTSTIPVYEMDVGIAQRMQQELTTDHWEARQRPLWKLHWFTMQMMLGLQMYKPKPKVPVEEDERLSDWDLSISRATEEAAEKQRRFEEALNAATPQSPDSPVFDERPLERSASPTQGKSSTQQQFEEMQAKVAELQESINRMKALRPQPSMGLPAEGLGDAPTRARRAEGKAVTPLDFFDD